jgi:hypothetical protein
MEIILSTIYIAGILFCYAAYLSYYEGFQFWEAVKHVSFMALNLFIIILLSLPMIFILLFAGRLIRKARSK